MSAAPRRLLALSDSLAETDGVGCATVQILRWWRRAMPRLECDVLLARGHPPHDEMTEREFRPLRVLPPSSWIAQPAWRERICGWRAYRRALKAIGAPPELVFSFKDYPYAALGWRLAQRWGVPFWSIVHGTYGVRALQLARHRERALAMYRGAAGTVAVSEYTRDRLLDEAPLERLHVVPNGVDPQLGNERTLPGEQPWKGLRYVASLAACKERKGLHLALEAFASVAAEHPEHHWFIAGRTHAGSAYRQRLVRRIEELGLGARVHLLGPIDPARKVDLLRGAELHLFTPVTAADGAFEGFGLPYLEAAVLGVPSLGTRNCGAEQALDDEALGTLVEPRAEAVAAALRTLLRRTTAQRCAHSEAAYHAALERSWERSARRLWDLVIGREGAP